LLKFLIVALLIALAVSLFSGFYFLMTDQGDKEKRGTVNSLGVRVTLAVSLMIVVVYGVATGQLGSQAPWEQPQPATSQDSE
jgi:formate hydrogenlyase subunit 3/multisubunit Na+/H+ antiporter MnhD subunit